MQGLLCLNRMPNLSWLFFFFLILLDGRRVLDDEGVQTWSWTAKAQTNVLSMSIEQDSKDCLNLVFLCNSNQDRWCNTQLGRVADWSRLSASQVFSFSCPENEWTMGIWVNGFRQLVLILQTTTRHAKRLEGCDQGVFYKTRIIDGPVQASGKTYGYCSTASSDLAKSQTQNGTLQKGCWEKATNFVKMKEDVHRLVVRYFRSSVEYCSTHTNKFQKLGLSRPRECRMLQGICKIGSSPCNVEFLAILATFHLVFTLMTIFKKKLQTWRRSCTITMR